MPLAGLDAATPPPCFVSTATALQRERVTQVLGEGHERIGRGGGRRRGTSVSASARARAASADRRATVATNHETMSADRDEHDERDDVVAVVDRPAVQRREEEPVGVEGRRHRGDQRPVRCRRVPPRPRRRGGRAAGSTRVRRGRGAARVRGEQWRTRNGQRPCEPTASRRKRGAALGAREGEGPLVFRLLLH